MAKGIRMSTNPLNDGSIASYVMRFLIAFMLGVFLILILLASTYCFGIELFALCWPIFLVIPLSTGILGIFKFNAFVQFYERIHRSYIDHISP